MLACEQYPSSYNIPDRKECAFNNCGELAVCADSTLDMSVALNKFKCTCPANSFYFADMTTVKTYDNGYPSPIPCSMTLACSMTLTRSQSAKSVLLALVILLQLARIAMTMPQLRLINSRVLASMQVQPCLVELLQRRTRTQLWANFAEVFVHLPQHATLSNG